MSQRVRRTPAAAEYIGLKPSTLEKWRLLGKGPRFIKIGSRSVGYTEADLDAFIEADRRTSTSDDGTNLSGLPAHVPPTSRGVTAQPGRNSRRRGGPRDPHEKPVAAP